MSRKKSHRAEVQLLLWPSECDESPQKSKPDGGKTKRSTRVKKDRSDSGSNDGEADDE